MSQILWEGLTFAYSQNAKHPTLEGVELSVDSGSFTVLTGPSGCGKSTLLYLAAGLYPNNGGVVLSGRVTVDGREPGSIPPEERAPLLGMIFQNPDLQFCMDTVEHELVFCMENIALPVEEMEARMAQALDFCGISHLRRRRLITLSGGEKQRAMLACVMVLRPRWLLLDEPFANLDEGSALELAGKLRQLHDQYGVGVVAVDHNPWLWRHAADEIVALGEKGAVARRGIPGDCRDAGLLAQLNISCPELPYQDAPPDKPAPAGGPPLVLEGVTVRREGHAVLEGLSAHFARGRIHAILGSSGCGKTTLFQALCGMTDYQGSILVEGRELRRVPRRELGGRMGFVFQSPQDQFVCDTVLEEITLSLKSAGEGDVEERARRVLREIGLWRHRLLSPYMLSQGQQRRLGVAALLAYRCPLLVCDEPTYAQDRNNVLAVMDELQRRVVREGLTLIFSTHDRLLAAGYADHIYEMKGGQLHEIDQSGL